MNTDEINDFLNYYSKEIININSLDKLYEIYIELTVKKSELHKLIHFCLDDYERKQYFASIDLATSIQTIVYQKIASETNTKLHNLKFDYKIEKENLRKEIDKQIHQAVLFKEFCCMSSKESVLFLRECFLFQI
ncbi:hypothetical protein M3B46_13125 [Sphingobacterium daejeonense]|uniref:hypothetical protein n=1 Tax=Sphingobacterium daejeonense TaxID=371142 RepID=UPI0021A28745|nr:hypothetical protein [Sphingobacterium daejeonense]MCT1531938.1 hypothetical protein [Sphingobacterium daejeonense]